MHSNLHPAHNAAMREFDGPTLSEQRCVTRDTRIERVSELLRLTALSVLKEAEKVAENSRHMRDADFTHGLAATRELISTANAMIDSADRLKRGDFSTPAEPLPSWSNGKPATVLRERNVTYIRTAEGAA